MHPLHDYFARQLADKLTRRGVGVWYDPRREFTPFFDELRGSPRRWAERRSVVRDVVLCLGV